MNVIKNPWNLVKHLEPMKELAGEKVRALGKFSSQLDSIKWALRDCTIAKNYTKFLDNITEYKLETFDLFKKNITHFFEREVQEGETVGLWVMILLHRKDNSVKKDFADHSIMRVDEIIGRQLEVLNNPSLNQELQKIAPGVAKGIGSIRILKSVRSKSKEFVEFLEKQRKAIYACEFNDLKESLWDERTIERDFFDLLNSLHTFNRRTAMKGIAASVGAALLGRWGSNKIKEGLKIDAPASDHPRIANLPLKELIKRGHIPRLIYNKHMGLGPFTNKNTDQEVIIIGERHYERVHENIAKLLEQAIPVLKVDSLGFEPYYGPPRKDLLSDFRNELKRRIGTGKIQVGKIGDIDHGEGTVVGQIEAYPIFPYLRQSKKIATFGVEDEKLIFENYVILAHHALLDTFLSLRKQVYMPHDLPARFLKEVNRYTTFLLDQNKDLKMPFFCPYILVAAKGNAWRTTNSKIFNQNHAEFHKKQGNRCKMLKKDINSGFYESKKEEEGRTLAKLIKKGLDPRRAAKAVRQIHRNTDPGIEKLMLQTRKEFDEFEARIFRVWGPERNKAMTKNIEKYMKKLKSRRAIIVVGEGHVNAKEKLVKPNEELQKLIPYTSLVIYAR